MYSEENKQCYMSLGSEKVDLFLRNAVWSPNRQNMSRLSWLRTIVEPH